MAEERIQEGFDVFVHDGEKAFGAVRQVSPKGRAELVIYIENAGDFIVPLAAVNSVHDEKVVLNSNKLEPKLQAAIRAAHSREDPTI